MAQLTCSWCVQTPGTERILYGLDDVKSSAEIIIVEGEMDKLALDEAGLQNVISVPDGAPRAVKEGDLPPPEADTKFQYLWNCRAVLDQAVRIVLATDSDAPGQVAPHAHPSSAARPCCRLTALLCWACRRCTRQILHCPSNICAPWVRSQALLPPLMASKASGCIQW